MKTVLHVIGILIFLTSCQESQFYEKDILKQLNDFSTDIVTTPDQVIDQNTGETTGGGSGDDGANPQYQTITDQFVQDQNAPRKVDILWVIDNSGSMSDNQAALAYNFEIFINQFVDKNVDFKMAITTTDPRSSHVGNIWKDSHLYLTTQKLHEDRAAFIDNFKSLIKVGTRGSGIESGLFGSKAFVEKNGTSFLREDAYFIIFYVSDEEDQSTGTSQSYADFLMNTKTNAGFVKTYSIVNMSQHYTLFGLTNGYERYANVSQKTSGTTSDINQDFHNTLNNIGENIATLIESFPLSHEPIGEIKVLVNDVQILSGWNYDLSTRTIKFDNSAIPAEGANIKVSYKYEI